MNRPWSLADAPALAGRRAVVTGANRGLGLVLAEILAGRGAAVVLACRDPAGGDQARRQILSRCPGATVDVVVLDLADPDSVAAAAETLRRRGEPIDLLVNNAAAILPPAGRTTDGIEVAFATNHLGHFALTGLLLPDLATGARVVTMSSMLHRVGRLDRDDLVGSVTRDPPLGPWRAYARSKFANLVFTAELQRRIDASGDDVAAVAAHPGHATTHADSSRPDAPWLRPLRPLLDRVGQTAAEAVLSALRAGVDPEVRGGTFYGPAAAGERRGPPVDVGLPRRAADPVLGIRLWEASEQLTGVSYPFVGRRSVGGLS